MSFPEARDRLLARVKDDNNIIKNIDKKIMDVRKTIENYEKQLKDMRMDLEVLIQIVQEQCTDETDDL